MSTFLLKHPNLKGNCDIPKYEGCVELVSFGYDVSRPLKMATGYGGNREVGSASVSTINITKKYDASSGPLMNEVLSSNPVDCNLIVLQAADSGMQEVFNITLYSSLISSLSLNANNGLNESFQISYTKILNSYTPLGEDNKPKSSFKVGFDLTTAKKI